MPQIDEDLRQIYSDAGTEGILTRLRGMDADARKDMNADARAAYVRQVADEIDPQHLIADEDERLRQARYEIGRRMAQARREKRARERAERVAA